MKIFVLCINGNDFLVLAKSYEFAIGFLIGAGRVTDGDEVTVKGMQDLTDNRVVAVPFNGKLNYQEVK